MAILDIVLYPDDPLTRKAASIDDVGPEVATLASDMIETMAAYDGVGLAGPQVGVAERIVVIREPEHEPMCLVNPEILDAAGDADEEEGCISLPYLYATVRRAEHVRVQAVDERGRPVAFEASGLLARIVQHECDHLDGVVFPDRLDLLTRHEKLQEWETIRARLLAEQRSAHAD